MSQYQQPKFDEDSLDLDDILRSFSSSAEPEEEPEAPVHRAVPAEETPRRAASPAEEAPPAPRRRKAPEPAEEEAPKARKTPVKRAAPESAKEPEEPARKRRGPGFLVKLLSFVGVTLLAVVVILFGVVWVLEKGPSHSMTETFCRSVRETSAIRWISEIYLSDEELEQYITENTEEYETALVDTSMIHISASASAAGKTEDNVELINISSGTCKGKLLIIKDPKSVILGTSDNFGKEPGLLLTELVEKYDGIAGTNAGGFNDENGTGDGGRPQGLVISEGEIIWGSPNVLYNVVGIDYDGVLHVETITGNKALENGIRWGVSFVTHDGQASALIINGEIQKQNMGSGVNPRTAIGQRLDGAILLLVLDGRSISTLGATMEDICNIMMDYGAYNVGNLDGGSSSVMVYDGEIINNCASVTGPRKIPTAFIVLKEAAE